MTVETKRFATKAGFAFGLVAFLVAAPAFAADAPPDTSKVDPFPAADTKMDFPFDKALHMMLNDDGGGGGIGFSAAGPVFTAPALTDSQLKMALPGNTIRREQAVAFYFGTDGIVDGWKRDWSVADMSKCPSKLGDDWDVEGGKCYTAVKHVIHGKYTIKNNQVCMPAYSGKPEDGEKCYYIGFITSFAVIGDGQKMYGGGKDFVAGKVLESYTASFKPKP